MNSFSLALGALLLACGLLAPPASAQIALSKIPALASLAVLMGSGKRYAKKNPPPANRE